MMAEEWQTGVVELRRAGPSLQDLGIARAVSLYFRSISNFTRFHRQRNDAAVLHSELALAREFLALCRADSRIGFEASLQYLFLPLDIREKIAACRYILRMLRTR
jgi:hypothetical protein